MPTLKELYDDLRIRQGAERVGRAASSEDPFILKLIQLVLSYGAQIKASDLHIEPISTAIHDGCLRCCKLTFATVNDQQIREIAFLQASLHASTDHFIERLKIVLCGGGGELIMTITFFIRLAMVKMHTACHNVGALNV